MCVPKDKFAFLGTIVKLNFLWNFAYTDLNDFVSK